ncbi:hypothetical protein GCM10022226_78530 [Sphaerisporangium flaviroseum]|uniref:Uncharacterized protein n=1 Tax=Sphaerisporangium flaviroseum TaxID=509199 RepID=A0ABP7JGC0_9ACTN
MTIAISAPTAISAPIDARRIRRRAKSSRSDAEGIFLSYRSAKKVTTVTALIASAMPAAAHGIELAPSAAM